MAKGGWREEADAIRVAGGVYWAARIEAKEERGDTATFIATVAPPPAAYNPDRFRPRSRPSPR
jgi:hypothetical protein